MTSKYCGLCQRRHYVQAVETPSTTERPSLGAVLSVALIFGAYYFALAWVVSRV